MSESDASVLAAINLSDCSYRGRVLDVTETDRWVEEKYFKGWLNWFDLSVHRLGKGHREGRYLNIVEIMGRPALENFAYSPFLLAPLAHDWGDVSVECEVRSPVHWTFPANSSEEVGRDHQARVGVALRVQDGRRHYFCGFQNGNTLLIAARENHNWTVLNFVDFSVDPDRIYRLEARCKGARIQVFVDGELRLVVDDSRWSTGPSGLYGNTVCWYLSATVRAEKAEVAAIVKRRETKARELDDARKALPTAKIERRIPLSLPEGTTVSSGGYPVSVGGVLPLDKDFIVVQWTSRDRAGLLAVDLDGNERWRQDLASADMRMAFTVADVDRDGTPELIVHGDNSILLLDGATGKLRHSVSHLPGCTYLGHRRAEARWNKPPFVASSAGPDRPARIGIYQGGSWGGHAIWCFDHELKLRWKHVNEAGGRYGHTISMADVNNDGQEEFLAGYYALDDDGKVVWKVRRHDRITMMDHADNMILGPRTADGRAIAIVACSGGGALFMDISNGETLAHFRGLGHIQNGSAGNFRHDRPGQEAWVWTDWGGFGIYFLFDADGRVLHRFQPDPRVTWTDAVRWCADGRDLLLLQHTRPGLGLWDSYGRRVVALAEIRGFPAELLPPETGIPQAPCFLPIRLTGRKTDSLLGSFGQELLLIGPERA